MISKSLSTSQKYARLYKAAGRLAEFCQTLYPLLNAHSDDFGRLDGDPFTVKHVCLPISPRKVTDFAVALQYLDEVGLIRWYEIDDKAYVQIVKFDEHQPGLTKRTKSRIPECPVNFTALPGISGLTKNLPPELELNRTELKRTELKGREEDPDLAPKSTAPTRDLLAEFDRLHREHVGVKAAIDGAKDAALIAGIWRQRGTEETLRLMAEFFARPDDFTVRAGFTVGVFKSQIGKLLARGANVRPVHTTERRTAAQTTIATMRDAEARRG